MDDSECLDSLDKYKHLEDTPFKQNFLNVLSNNIKSNLQKALKYNVSSVYIHRLCAYMCYFLIYLLFHLELDETKSAGYRIIQ